MKIITISREFGSGGRELGKRLADISGFDYYDSEIISAIAKKSGMDEKYIENTLSNHGWQNQTITFRGTLGSAAYMQSSKVALLLEQKKVIEEIAQLGKDCIIVGRNADVILEKYHPFNLFVCAKTEAKVNRCLARTSPEEKLTKKEILSEMKRIDKIRAQTRELISGSLWGQRDLYHLVINTTDWEIKDVVPAVYEYSKYFFEKNV